MRPLYKQDKHIQNLQNSPYYKNLIKLRSLIEKECDVYFSKFDAPKVDLYLISRAVSSPLGLGSDSEPLGINFGRTSTFLTDSAQFGMEPLVQKHFQMVYCYLPSFRGEDPDKYHMNQFYHCEAELRGGYKNAINVAEGLIKHLLFTYIHKYNTSIHELKANKIYLETLLHEGFMNIAFDDAYDLLCKQKRKEQYVESYDYGRKITRLGELKLCSLMNNRCVWVTNYDRNIVPFYQKPDPTNDERVLNADLIVPSLAGGLGGEILGLGERQDDVSEMMSSMKKQGVTGQENYKWYLDLRISKSYKKTSGFGLGVERFIGWMLSAQSIYDVSLYPVLKNSNSY